MATAHLGLATVARLTHSTLQVDSQVLRHLELSAPHWPLDSLQGCAVRWAALAIAARSPVSTPDWDNLRCQVEVAEKNLAEGPFLPSQAGLRELPGRTAALFLVAAVTTH